METTRYDYLDIPYLYQMSLGQILRVIGIQKAEIFQPSLKKNVGLQTQYIWFYQPYRSSTDCAPMLEICEVQVYGITLFF